MWQGIKHHREGVGYFSDPISKPSIWKYWGTLGHYTLNSLLNIENQPTVEGLEAIKNSPVPGSGDGVTVILSESKRQRVAPLSDVDFSPRLYAIGVVPLWVGRPTFRTGKSAERRVSVGCFFEKLNTKIHETTKIRW